MKGLLIKDWKLMTNQKVYLLLAFFLPFLYLIVLNDGDTSFMVTYFTILASMVGAGTITYDTYDNGAAYLFTLPVSRKGYVREKYVLVRLILAVTLTIMAVLSGLSAVVRNIDYKASESLVEMGVAVCLVTLLNALTIPLNLKFGAEKSKYVAVIGMGVVCLLVSALILWEGIYWFIDKLEKYEGLMAKAPVKGMAAELAGCAVVMAVSYVLSVRIMEKKEF